VWDAGSAKAVADAGADAVATSSWSMAAAQGFADGETMPFDLVEEIVGRIATTTDLPLTVDIEGGYAVEPDELADNIERIVSAGAVGINLEDGIIGGNGLHDTALQYRRIEAVWTRAARLGCGLFINARTDLFLQAEDRNCHAGLLEPAIERARAYADAGASGFFAPGLVDQQLIEVLCGAARLPVNVMVVDDTLSAGQLGKLGVSRVSYGPMPYIRCMQLLKEQVLLTHKTLV